MGADQPGKPSFWTSLPGVLTGGAALLTAVGGLLALWINNRPAPRAAGTEPPPAVQRGKAAVPSAPPAGTAADPTEPACYTSFLTDIPADHRKSANVGAADLRIIQPDETKKGAFALTMTEDDRPIGALVFTVRTADETFHISQVVDARCQSVPDVGNVSRGGGRVLQNWDEVRIDMNSGRYLIRFGYSSGEVTIGHFRRIVD